MYGYKVIPEGQPTVNFACTASIDNYSWKNINSAASIEIAVSKASLRHITINGKSFDVSGKLISSVCGTDDVSAYCDEGVKIDVKSVSLEFPRLSIIPGEITSEDLSDFSVLLLPAICDEFSENEIAEIERLMNRLIKHNTKNRMSDKLMCVSLFLEILSDVDALVRSHLEPEKEKYVNFYVKKVNSIIDLRYNEKLSLNDIARELDVAPGYLSAIYSRTMGICFSQKLFRTRMSHAKSLVLSQHLPVKEISQMVGIDDESYFRKRFKQYCGVSIRELRCIEKEMTLYHGKPEKN